MPNDLSSGDEVELRTSSMPTVLDRSHVFTDLLGVRVVPTFMLVNREGVIIGVREGLLEPAELHSRIVAAISGSAEEVAE